MNPDKQRAIARQGGQASHANGRAHEWSVEEARAAGVKGAQVSLQRRRDKKIAHLLRAQVVR